MTPPILIPDLGLFSSWGSLLVVVLKAVLLYSYTVVLLRIAGKRTTMSMTAFDFIVNIALGTLIASPIISRSITVADGVAGVTALVLLQTLVAYGTSRSDRFLWLVAGKPRMLYAESQFLPDRLRAERVSQSQLEQKIRAQGFSSVKQVQAVILESAGTVSVIGTGGSGDSTTEGELLEAVRE